MEPRGQSTCLLSCLLLLLITVLLHFRVSSLYTYILHVGVCKSRTPLLFFCFLLGSTVTKIKATCEFKKKKMRIIEGSSRSDLPLVYSIAKKVVFAFQHIPQLCDE